MQDLFQPTTVPQTYVTVILPLALPKEYTYAVPLEMVEQIKPGVRVEVQFGKNKLYSALVYQVSLEKPEAYTPKPIVSVLDTEPIVMEKQFDFWRWMAEYYCCTIGEVMNAALPSGLKLASETKLVLSPIFDGDFTDLNDREYLIAEALTIQNELTIEEVRKIVNLKSVYHLIDALLEKKVIFLEAELKHKYKVKTIDCIKLAEPYFSANELLRQAFEDISRASRQTEGLIAFIQLSKNKKDVTKKELMEFAGIGSGIIKELANKGILEIYKKEISRLNEYSEDLIDGFPLAEQQKTAIAEIIQHFKTQDVVLLKGVTGSGKTRVYIELIEAAMKRGEQVLYLLPEITLTAQIISRLQKIFGDDISVYHSRFNNAERVEIWQSVLNGKSVVVGARSSIFLPYRNLGLIIVDEEHDSSFKQHDPAPRYNARDMAVLMGQTHKAKVILGTATPSVETFQNTVTGKYGLVEMKERFGGLELPKVKIVDLKEETRKKKIKSNFSSVLLEELTNALERGEQAILFQNRRGYSPTLHCNTCGWVSECVNCDVSLTYHKFSNTLKCHYCGHHTKVPTGCPACGQQKIMIKGFGTEKIEDDLQILLPKAKIARMDFDTVRTKNAHTEIIHKFEQKEIDILVGTQMVTKGLDFDNVGVVGVLSADHLLHFPDFRASERAFQLMTQVSGRAGRKKKQGLVVIQAYDTEHPVLAEVFSNDFENFFRREIMERKSFLYPPFHRLIKIQISHRKVDSVKYGAEYFGNLLKEKLGSRVLGPTEPGISRVRSYYLRDILIKLERNKRVIDGTKNLLLAVSQQLQHEKGMSGIKINIDVDPY